LNHHVVFSPDHNEKLGIGTRSMAARRRSAFPELGDNGEQMPKTAFSMIPKRISVGCTR
jgi:hypothetical protein